MVGPFSKVSVAVQYDNCPVCGFADMPYAPVPYNVCPCCGTEFGVADYYSNPAELRRNWIAAGKPWFSDLRKPRKGWSASLQLINAGYGADLIRPIGSAAPRAKQESVRIAARIFWSPSELDSAIPIGAPI
jgi:hypothetical protein